MLTKRIQEQEPLNTSMPIGSSGMLIQMKKSTSGGRVGRSGRE
uniref:Uncharacterized protein n=1 Tax=Arundo donax TaxID=35708 RepID=A0A0A9E2K8_ARUDO